MWSFYDDHKGINLRPRIAIPTRTASGWVWCGRGRVPLESDSEGAVPKRLCGNPSADGIPTVVPGPKKRQQMRAPPASTFLTQTGVQHW